MNTLLQIAAHLRALDPRITYTSIGLQPGDVLAVSFQVDCDDAVRELGSKLGCSEPDMGRSTDSSKEWLRADLWTEVDGVRCMVSVYGPHRAVAVNVEPVSVDTGTWSPAHGAAQ